MEYQRQVSNGRLVRRSDGAAGSDVAQETPLVAQRAHVVSSHSSQAGAPGDVLGASQPGGALVPVTQAISEVGSAQGSEIQAQNANLGQLPPQPQSMLSSSSPPLGRIDNQLGQHHAMVAAGPNTQQVTGFSTAISMSQGLGI